MSDSRRIETRVIHAGQQHEPTTGAVMQPVFQTSTYAQPWPAKHTGYEYARTQNPTRSALEENVAALEGGRAGHAYASGMAAISTLTSLLESGDHVVASHNVYGGTYRFFHQIRQLFNDECPLQWIFIFSQPQFLVDDQLNRHRPPH